MKAFTKKRSRLAALFACACAQKSISFLMVNNTESRQIPMSRRASVLRQPTDFRTPQPFCNCNQARTSCVICTLAHRRMVMEGNDLRSPARLPSLMTVLRTFSSCSDANDERQVKPAPDIDMQSHKLSLVSAINDLDSPARPSSLIKVL